MTSLDETLKLNSCPRCSVDYPNMVCEHTFSTAWDSGIEPKKYRVYVCKRCGGAVLAMSFPPSDKVVELYPSSETANINLPEKVRAYLDEAMRSTSTPAACVMVCNSAVDSMLKAKGRTEGSVYSRIEDAVKDGLLTEEMGKWAHQVRLEANGQRHADEEFTIPTVHEAKLSVEFAKMLGEFLFVLPAKVTLGIAGSTTKVKKPTGLQPRKIKLPNAYRNVSYRHVIILDDSDDKPIVTAKLYYTSNGPLIKDLVPEQLEVTNRPGNPKWWSANFAIPDCKKLPTTLFVEILVNGEVRQVGSLSVSNVATNA